MKNISLGLFFILFLLPQVSFGANSAPIGTNPPVFTNPGVTSCKQRLDIESKAFFDQQGQERGAFIAANQDLITKTDRLGRWKASHKDGKVHPGDTQPVPEDLTPTEQNTFTAFTQKQQSDKSTFLAKLAQQEQACLNSQAVTNP